MTRRTDWQRPWNEFATSMGAAPLSSRYMQRYTGTFETLHHWFYAFWHRRKLEGNDALVLDALGWIRRVYGAT